jgi:hypothetical protein
MRSLYYYPSARSVSNSGIAITPDVGLVELGSSAYAASTPYQGERPMVAREGSRGYAIQRVPPATVNAADEDMYGAIFGVLACVLFLGLLALALSYPGTYYYYHNHDDYHNGEPHGHRDWSEPTYTWLTLPRSS